MVTDFKLGNFSLTGPFLVKYTQSLFLKRQSKKDLIVLQIPYIGVSSFSLWRQLATL